jgi:hypothetical protein
LSGPMGWDRRFGPNPDPLELGEPVAVELQRAATHHWLLAAMPPAAHRAPARRFQPGEISTRAGWQVDPARRGEAEYRRRRGSQFDRSHLMPPCAERCDETNCGNKALRS